MNVLESYIVSPLTCVCVCLSPGSARVGGAAGVDAERSALYRRHYRQDRFTDQRGETDKLRAKEDALCNQ